MFYCTLTEQGCAFQVQDESHVEVVDPDDEHNDLEVKEDNDQDMEGDSNVNHDPRHRQPAGRCDGRLQMERTKTNVPYIW